MAQRDYAESVNAHYGRPNLSATIFDATQRAGKDPAALTPDDLAPVDQFHTRGKDATLELARMAEVHAGQQVLDVGGGLGGPARTLAQEFDCRVTVLDLTEEFCRAGEALTERTGLSDRVSFRHGNALEMPFADGSFDTVWTQHSTMNIAAKEKLYAEVGRVLRPGGRLAMHEIMEGPVQPLQFPVPWAPDQSISFLAPPGDLRRMLAAAGLTELSWVDVTASTVDWLRGRIAVMSAAPTAAPQFGLHLILGPAISDEFGNLFRNLEEERLVVIEAVFEKG